MLLRSLTKHVKDQNWFAVFLDFFIVVAGILIAFQITAWNEVRQKSALGNTYLTRIAEDLTAMEDYLVGQIDTMNDRHALTARLLKTASNGETGDTAVIKATQDFFTDAWITPRFTIVDTVFEDLSSTGNMSLISEPIRRDITSYYEGLKSRREAIENNRDWSLPNDSSIIIDHDVYRWDRNYLEVTGKLDEARAHESILLARDELARLASMYYYMENSALDSYAAVLDDTRQLAKIITVELENR